jgi:LysM repeat protein
MLKQNYMPNRPWPGKGTVVFLLVVTMLVAMLGSVRTAAAQSPCGNTTTVIFGDTLEEIAQRCETTVEAILWANPEITDTESLQIGRVLIVPPSEDPAVPITYTVQPGDWLIQVAQRYDTTLATILAANPDITNPNRIQVGQEIVIPVGGEDGDAAVTISPMAGPAGTAVQVTAVRYAPNAEIIVGIGRPNAEPITSHTVTTDEEGIAVTTVTVPTDARANERYTVLAYEPGPDGARATSGNFLVTGEPAVGDGNDDQDDRSVAVRISPASGPPGTRIQVDASGLPANAAVAIGAGRAESEYDIISVARSDAQGSLDHTVRIPHLATPGEMWVVAVTPTDSPADHLSNTFRVVEPTDGDTQNLFTRTNIYLIALDDEGSTGMQIGCNDSVVPVEVEIEPTQAVLTAAMEALLDVDERFYGQSGLYNALSRSALTVQEIRIEDRTAVIRLTGQVSLGGVCDVPRFRAQLHQTALQFHTVDSVSVFINGEALDQVIR